MSTTTNQQDAAATDLTSMYCVNYKSPAFIGTIVAIILLLLSSCVGAFFGGKSSAKGAAVAVTEAVTGGADSDDLMSLKDFLASMS